MVLSGCRSFLTGLTELSIQTSARLVAIHRIPSQSEIIIRISYGFQIGALF